MEREGVIKFDLAFVRCVLADIDIAWLRAWRQIFCSLGLLGCDPERYEGLGFGNVSMRTPGGFVISGSQTGDLPNPGLEAYAEVVSWDLENNGIVARGMVEPSSESLTHAAVYDLSPRVQFVFHVHSPEVWRWIHTASSGGEEPESQNVDVPKTGGGVKNVDVLKQEQKKQNVDVLKQEQKKQNVDVLNREQKKQNVDVPETGVGVAYGTPAMAREVWRVCAGRGIPNAFIMGGHQDGVVAYGADASAAGTLLIGLLAESLTTD